MQGKKIHHRFEPFGEEMTIFEELANRHIKCDEYV